MRLFIPRRIAELHGGRVGMQGGERGTVFFLELPGPGETATQA